MASMGAPRSFRVRAMTTDAETSPVDEDGRRRQALALYLAGADHTAITRRCGYGSEEEMRADVAVVLSQRAGGESKDVLRVAAAMKLDRLEARLWTALGTEGVDPETAEKLASRISHIIAQRTDLLGLKRRPPPPPHLHETPPPRLGAST